MAIGKVSGVMLQSNLERQGAPLAFDGNLLYLDVASRRVGINTSNPTSDFTLNGTARLGNLLISGDSITNVDGNTQIQLGSIDQVKLTGGDQYDTVYTNGQGRLSFGNLKSIIALQGLTLLDIPLGVTSSSGGSVGTQSLTTGLSGADAIALLDDIVGNITNVTGNVITTGNLFLTGGNVDYVLKTNGQGITSFVDANTIPAIISINSNLATTNTRINNVRGNTIILGSNTAGYLVSNAVSLTTSTYVTDAISQMNFVLGKLVPPSPPPFPGASTLTLSTAVSTGRISNFTQTDNSGWGNLSVAGGTSVSATRVNTYAAGTITSVGPGDSGTVTAYFNGVSAGTVTMATGSQNGTYSNLIIANDQDYHNVVSSVTAGFWESFNASLSGSNVPAGWNRASIDDTAGSQTNTVTWYYDNSTPGTPTFSNTSIALYSNSVSYSSTVPHFTSSASFIIKGNVARLSGDTYPLAVTSSASQLISSAAGGAIQAPAVVSYAGAGVTVPLARNLYVSSGSAYFETTAAVTTGFGSSTGGPTLSATNNYATGTSSPLIVSGTPTILYKTGTASLMEETNITFGSTVGTGSSQAYRIVSIANSDTPAYTGNESAFSTLQTYDATIVAAVLKYDTTNYSTGYLPVGPNLSAQGASQYFTFKFVRTALSKFNIKFSGTIAGMWVALPGSAIDTSSTLNGWLNMSTAYAGSGTPGAGTGGNGSNGCALGGTVTLGSAVTAHSKTCTFGTRSTSDTATNAVYVRIKLTSGQSLTALSLETATN
jgi:hypothetical protein